MEYTSTVREYRYYTGKQTLPFYSLVPNCNIVLAPLETNLKVVVPTAKNGVERKWILRNGDNLENYALRDKILEVIHAPLRFVLRNVIDLVEVQSGRIDVSPASDRIRPHHRMHSGKIVAHIVGTATWGHDREAILVRASFEVRKRGRRRQSGEVFAERRRDAIVHLVAGRPELGEHISARAEL